MRARVTVADYGIGNLLSVQRAFEHCGAEVEVSSDPRALERAERLVLPGVGAFRDAMEGLRSHGFIEPLQRFAASGRPFLGICVGMQMMFEAGEEHGMHPGLGLLPGRVVAIPAAPGRKIPHIGWAALIRPSLERDWAETILEAVPAGGASVYFVHSFHAAPARADDVLAVSDYHGFAVTAAVSRGNLSGCQFHPEKSGETGLKIIEAFLGAKR
jgi:imidazole glycerol-phosphate synthase subunit HisH